MLHAASETDVTIIKAKQVVIEEQMVTVTAEAKTMIRVFTPKDDHGKAQGTFLGRPYTSAWIISDHGTFVVRRPPLRFNDPQGTHTQERERSQKVLDEGWAMTLEAAKELQDGKEVGRIGYYQPKVTIEDSQIISIEGEGYLYPKGK